jgi:DNA-directed RNA polymerase specialized sigma24 family protein
VQNVDDYPEQAVDPVLATKVQDWLTHGLNRLPIELRSTLELAYRMGYSMEEIAAITDSPIGTVKTRMPARGKGCGSICGRAPERPRARA